MATITNYFLRCWLAGWLLQYSARETTIWFVYVLRQKVRGATGIIVIALCTRKARGRDMVGLVPTE